MSELSVVRRISHGGVCLAVRHGGGGRPTTRWQDKSRKVRTGRSAAECRCINDLAQCAPWHDNVPIGKIAIPPRGNAHCVCA